MRNSGEGNARGRFPEPRAKPPGGEHASRGESAGARRNSASRKAPTETSLSDLVRQWMRQNRAEDRLDPWSLFGRWKEVVGEDIAAHTRIVSADRGELLVEVDSACLLNELSTYYGQEILESLSTREEFRGVHKLRFRSGAF